jgi:hypothetical protein
MRAFTVVVAITLSLFASSVLAGEDPVAVGQAKPTPSLIPSVLRLRAGSDGIANQIVKYDSSGSGYTGSTVYEVAGQVGINQASPTSTLHINGVTRGEDRFEVRRGGSNTWGSGSGFFLGTSVGDYVGMQLSPENNIDFWLTNAGYSPARLVTMTATGKVGIGTTTPATKLEVAAVDTHGILTLDGGDSSAASNGWVQLAFGYAGTATYEHFIRTRHNGGTATTNAIDFYTSDGTQNGVFPTNAVHGLTVTNGRIGIGGNINPQYNLHVTGTAYISGAATVHGDMTVDGNIAAKFQDVAEWVPATTHMEPGTVVILNREHENEVTPSAHAYDTAVAGVVSEQPGLILGVAGASKAQIATTGRVKVHVTTAGGAIRIGDLLVTSDESGVAMKSQPVELGGVAIHRPGTLIGKALQPLQTGEGDIPVLLSLQ